MRLSIIILISALTVGSIVIALGILTNQQIVDVPEITSQYEKLEKYKNDLEKINLYNQQVLEDLENQITNSSDIPLEEINDEIEVIKRVINDNKAELEEVIKKLSEMEPKP